MAYPTADAHNAATRPLVIGVTPAGRRRHLAILIKFLLQQRNVLDEHHFWINTSDAEDIKFIKDICLQYPGFFKCVECQIPVNGTASIYSFFPNYCDSGTVYVRIDDDICYIAPNALAQLIEFRIANKDYFLVYANIVNNAVIDHLRQRNGLIRNAPGLIEYNCTGNGWRDPRFAVAVHTSYLDDIESGRSQLHQKIFDRHILTSYERVSINAISWFGADMGLVIDAFPTDEEHFLACVAPSRLARPNAITGQPVMAHYSFHTQREQLNQTDILRRYEEIACRCVSH